MFFNGHLQVKSVVPLFKICSNVDFKGQQTMVFIGILECTVRSIKTGERCRPSGPEMYFICSITHRDRTYVRYWSTVMKLPLTSDLFRFYPHLNGVLLATGTKRYTNQYLNFDLMISLSVCNECTLCASLK